MLVFADLFCTTEITSLWVKRVSQKKKKKTVTLGTGDKFGSNIDGTQPHYKMVENGHHNLNKLSKWLFSTN